MIRAIWNDMVLAESPRTLVVEGNYYFPPDSVRMELLTPSRLLTPCFWKGLASYYHLNLDGDTYKDAAWSYPHPFIWVRWLRNYVAFSYWQAQKIKNRMSNDHPNPIGGFRLSQRQVRTSRRAGVAELADRSEESCHRLSFATVSCP